MSSEEGEVKTHFEYKGFRVAEILLRFFSLHYLTVIPDILSHWMASLEFNSIARIAIDLPYKQDLDYSCKNRTDKELYLI